MGLSMESPLLFSVSGLIISGASGKRKGKMSAYRVPEKMPAYRVPILKSYFYRTGAYQIGHHQEGNLRYCGEGDKGAKKPGSEESGIMKRKRPSLRFNETKKTVPLFQPHCFRSKKNGLRRVRHNETKKTVPLFHHCFNKGELAEKKAK